MKSTQLLNLQLHIEGVDTQSIVKGVSRMRMRIYEKENQLTMSLGIGGRRTLYFTAQYGGHDLMIDIDRLGTFLMWCARQRPQDILIASAAVDAKDSPIIAKTIYRFDFREFVSLTFEYEPDSSDAFKVCIGVEVPSKWPRPATVRYLRVEALALEEMGRSLSSIYQTYLGNSTL